MSVVTVILGFIRERTNIQSLAMCKFFVLAVFAACLVMPTEAGSCQSSTEFDSCESSSDPKSGKKGVQLLQSVSTINKLVPLDAADTSLTKEGDRAPTESVLQSAEKMAKVHAEGTSNAKNPTRRFPRGLRTLADISKQMEEHVAALKTILQEEEQNE